MFYNFRIPVVLFIASFLFMFTGMLFKILHWPGGNLLFGSMIMVQAISIIWLIIIIVRPKKP